MSANAMRFLLMAGTKASTFLADFRELQDGEMMSLWQTNPTSLGARQATVHNGVGGFFSDAARSMIRLRYRTHQYDYDEGTTYLGPNGCSIVTVLSISNQRFPNTVLMALPGRRLSDVIGYNSTPAFFASQFTTVVPAEMTFARQRRDRPDPRHQNGKGYRKCCRIWGDRF